MIFGFGKKKAPSDLRGRLMQLATETVAAIGGAYDAPNDQLLFRGFSLDVSSAAQRKKMRAEFADLWARLSRNPDDWKRDIQLIQEQVRSEPNPSNHMLAAFQFFAGILKMNFLCKAALEYPDDAELRHVVFAILNTNAAVIDRTFDDDEDRAEKSTDDSGENMPSFEIFSEAIYISRFLNQVTGVDRI